MDNEISNTVFDESAKRAGARLARFTLTDPVMITARLMAGVTIDNAFISIEHGGATSDGRRKYHYFIDLPGQSEYENDDLASGVGGGSLQSGLESLLGFLAACGESWNYTTRNGGKGENADLFSPRIAEWAAQNSDELSMLECELTENPAAIVEE